MRKDNWFVVILVALCLALATMAAVSSTEAEGDKAGAKGLYNLNEATAPNTRYRLDEGVSHGLVGVLSGSKTQRV